MSTVGPIDIGPPSAARCGNARPPSVRRSRRSAGRRSFGCATRYRKLLGRGGCEQHIVTAVGRELLGFIWAIGVAVEREQQENGDISSRRGGPGGRDGGGARWWPRGTRKGEPSSGLCGKSRMNPLLALSPRWLQDNKNDEISDYAVPTREYQSDQPSRQLSRPPPVYFYLRHRTPI